jgi:hypothetical protein
MKEFFFPDACLRCFQHQLGKRKFDFSGEKKSADHNATRIYCETWKNWLKIIIWLTKFIMWMKQEGQR